MKEDERERERGRAWERQKLWVDIGGCRTSSDGDDGGYMYHLHLGVIRVCAIRSVACAGRRRRQRWRLTHLAATVVDILARTDQQGRTYTLRATIDANLAVKSPRLDCRRWEESAVERGSRVAVELRRTSSTAYWATKKGLRHCALRLRRRYSTVVVGALGSSHREWREVSKEAVN